MTILKMVLLCSAAANALPHVVHEDYKLLASDGIAGDDFGRDVCISGSAIIIGADYADVPNTLKRVYAGHFSRNPSSGRVLQKLGFTHEGTHINHEQKWGKLENIDMQSRTCNNSALFATHSNH